MNARNKNFLIGMVVIVVAIVIMNMLTTTRAPTREIGTGSIDDVIRIAPYIIEGPPFDQLPPNTSLEPSYGSETNARSRATV